MKFVKNYSWNSFDSAKRLIFENKCDLVLSSDYDNPLIMKLLMLGPSDHTPKFSDEMKFFKIQEVKNSKYYFECLYAENDN
jgi:hypothetical protein